MELYNKLSREEAVQQLNSEMFKRRTVSFYRYFSVNDPVAMRDDLFLKWNAWQCFGRIYVAHEGVNAQMSVPEHFINDFVNDIQQHVKGLEGVPLKWAIADNGKSFYKLTVKVRKKIVADGLPEGAFDTSDVGKHLTALQFHNMAARPDTLVIDMRNHYESEVGRFKSAFCPDADTFREAIKIVENKFKNDKNKKVLLYCTGGIRCEKASAYLKHKGFTDVNQLHGGIVEYAQQIKVLGLESAYTGKNFVFDQRLGEAIDGKVIAKCHQCGNVCDTHTNCANDDCHLLFIQCNVCKEKYEGCCSNDCKEINRLPYNEKKKMRIERHRKYSDSKIFKSRLRPIHIHS